MMTIATGVQAVSEANYGRTDEAMWYVDRIVQTFNRKLPGSISEMMPDYGCFAIAWTSYGIVVPLIQHVFGVQPDAVNKNVVFDPHLPTRWSDMSIEDLPVGNNLVSFSRAKTGRGIEYGFEAEESGWTFVLKVKGSPGAKYYLNGKPISFGDRAKVYARSDQDGYLIALRSDGAGRVRVLFPLDPQDDQRITGGKKYELKGRGGREAFVADNTNERGTVLAAISESPVRVDQFTQNGRWNTPALSTPGMRDDPESGLLALIERMKAPDQRLDYDVATSTATLEAGGAGSRGSNSGRWPSKVTLYP